LRAAGANFRGRGQLLAPPGEQPLDLGLRRRDTQLRHCRGTWPVHLVERNLDRPTGQVDDLDAMAQLQSF